MAASNPTPSKIGRLTEVLVMNLIPLYGVFFLGWDAKLFILSYFLETMILILFHSVRLWYVHARWGNTPEVLEQRQKFQPTNGNSSLPPNILPLFLLVFCGIFIFVQTLILGGFAERAFPDGIFTAMYRAAQGELAWVLGGFAVVQLFIFMREIISSKYAGMPAEELFFQPFRRIFVQQLTVILGGFVVMFGGGTAYLFVLVLVNIAADLFGFFIDNAKLKAALVQGDPEREKQYEEMKKVLGDGN
jgi:Family of unknown function (DUF6498)